MNVPTLSFWWHLLATLGFEISCLAGLGFLAQRLCRSASSQRALWQIVFVGLLLVAASDFTGFGRGAAQFCFGQKQVAAKARPIAPPAHASAVRPQVPVKINSTLLRPPSAVFWPGWVWLAGTVIVLGRIAAAQALLVALRLRRERIAHRSLQERVEEIAQRVGLRRKVNLLRMPVRVSPMAFGLARPTIGLPLDFATAYSEAEQDAVLAHELAHLAAHDPCWFLLADFASAVLWWHPLVWWARRSLHLTAELAADEETALVPNGPDALARCLVTLGKKMAAPRSWGWIGVNGRFQSRLGLRVERLLRLSKATPRPRTLWSGAPRKVMATLVVLPGVVLLFGVIQTAHGQRQDTWQKEISASWNSSPGAQLLAAALDGQAARKESIETQVRNAKFLYEEGKLHEAFTILTQVSNNAPSNKTARYYLDLIRSTSAWQQSQPIPLHTTAQPMVIPLTWYEEPMLIPLDPAATPQFVQALPASIAQPNDLATSNPWPDTNLVYTSEERVAILSKLDRMRLNQVEYQAVPLTEVLNQLRTESIKLDPEGVGLKFMVNPSTETTGIGGSSTTKTAAATAAQDGGIGGRQMVDMGQITITISPPMSNPRLADVLDAIIMGSDHPLRCTLKDYGVVFSPKQDEQAALISKVFRVDPKTFLQRLQSVSAMSLNPGTSAGSTGGGATGDQGNSPNSTSLPIDTVALHQLLRQFFTARGVTLTDPGKSLFFNDRTGLIYVRATEQDLEIIQGLVSALNRTPP